MMCVAMVLLSAAAVDIILVDCLLPAFGAGAGVECDFDGSHDHDCFCCCRHVVPSVPVVLRPTDHGFERTVVSHLTLVSCDRASVYHPPRA